MSRTPIKEDKRFLLTASTILVVLGMAAFGREPSEQVLTFIGITLGAFMGQSQWGQTKRAITPAPPAEPPK